MLPVTVLASSGQRIARQSYGTWSDVTPGRVVAVGLSTCDGDASCSLRHPMSSVGTGVFCPYAIRHCPDRSNHR